MLTLEKKRKYFAVAAKKSRNKKRLEANGLKERNEQLETQNKLLKRKCDVLRSDYDRLRPESVRRRICPDNNHKSNYLIEKNKLLKEELLTLKKRKEHIMKYLFLFNTSLNLKTDEYSVKSNLNELHYKLHTLNLNTKLKEYSQVSFNFGNYKLLKNINLKLYFDHQIQQNKKEYITSRLEIEDISINKNRLMEIWLKLQSDKNFRTKLNNICYPNRHEDLFTKCLYNLKKVTVNDKFAVHKSSPGNIDDNERFYTLTGYKHENNGLSSVIVSSLVSDYKSKLEDLELNEPRNLTGLILSQGKDKDHTNISMFANFQDTSLALNKSERIKREIYLKFIKKNSWTQNCQYFQLFLNQCVQLSSI